MVSLLTDAPYTSAKWALISPVVSPRLARLITTVSTSDRRRCRLPTMTGSNVPSRSLGTSISTAPAASVSTVLDRLPLRELPRLRPCTAFLSYPRCSLISSSSAVSITSFVSDFNSPPGPVRSTPASRAWRTSSRASSSPSSGSGPSPGPADDRASSPATAKSTPGSGEPAGTVGDAAANAASKPGLDFKLLDGGMPTSVSVITTLSAEPRPADQATYTVFAIDPDAGSQGGFNWSSQHSDLGGVHRWGRLTGVGRRARCLRGCVGSGARIERCDHRCDRPVRRLRPGQCSVSSGG
jgi:hypothetical protein